MAIDQQIQEKVDAYRNNPEALQKNYQMNQDLLDLLALQKIKSEKDAAARELQMSMEQDPQTIAGQRMAEEGKRTKDELVKQVGGVAKTLASKQQQNLQNATAGIASQPAPNMRFNAAGGGIVSFAEGDPVKAESKSPEELLASVNFKGGVDRFLGLDRATQERVLNTINSQRSVMRPGVIEKGMAMLVDAVQAPLIAAVGVGADVARGAGVMDPEQKAFLEQPYNSMQQAMKGREDAFPPVSMSQLRPSAAEVNKAGDVTADMSAPGLTPSTSGPQQQPTDTVFPTAPEPSAIKMRGIGGTPQGGPPIGGIASATSPLAARASLPKDYKKDMQGIEDLQRKFGSKFIAPRLNQDPKADRTEAREDADKYLDRTGIAAKYKSMQARNAALSEKLTKRAQTNRFNDITAGVTSFRDVGTNARSLRRQDALDEERRLAEELGIEQAGLTADVGIATKALDTGEKRGEVTTTDIANASRDATVLIDSMGDNISEAAKLSLSVDKANMTREERIATIKSNEIIAQLGRQTQIAVAEYTGKIKMRGDDIMAKLNATKNVTELFGLENEIDKLIATVKQGVSKSVTDRIAIDVQAMKLKPADRRAKIKEMTALERKNNEALLEDLISRKERIAAKIGGGGFSNLQSSK